MDPRLYVIIAAILFSLNGILIRMVGADAFAIAGIRSAIGIVIQFVFITAQLRYIEGSSNPFRCAVTKLLRGGWSNWMAALFFALSQTALLWAIQLGKVGNAIFLQFGGIVLISLLSGPILKKWPTSHDWFAVIVALTGISLLAKDGFEDDHRSTLLGLFCAVAFAGQQIVFGWRAQQGKSSLESVLLANVLMAGIGLGATLTRGVPSFTGAEWLCLLVMGVFTWGLADVFYTLGVKKLPIFRAVIIQLSNPVLAVTWPVFLGEFPSPTAAIGGAVVLLAVAYQAYFTQEDDKPMATTVKC